MIKTVTSSLLLLLCIATTSIAQERVKLLCKGLPAKPEYQYLNGTTTNGLVNLAPNKNVLYSGSIWEKMSLGGNVFAFRCLNDHPNPKYVYLNGITSTGEVKLAPDTKPPYSGTHWKEVRLKDGTVAYECLNNDHNPKYLFLNGMPGTGVVNLVADKNESGTVGTHWMLERK